MTRVQFPNIAMTGNMFTSAPRVCARWPQQMSDDAILFVLRRLARPGHVWVCQKPQDKYLMLLPCARLTPRFSNCGVLADGWFSCCAGHHTVPRRFKSSSAGSSLFSKPASIVGPVAATDAFHASAAAWSLSTNSPSILQKFAESQWHLTLTCCPQPALVE